MVKLKAYLHEDILAKIFLRMPTKPLVRLKCVSKQWKRLISDPNFMKSRSRRMIFLPGLPLHALDINDPSAPSMIKLSFPFYRVHYKEITLVGSFKGIVLLILYYSSPDLHDVILYNPFSGEFKKVLDPQPSNLSLFCTYVYGFGYGTSPDDLKIVKIKKYTNNGDSQSVEIYSLKTWSWSKHSGLIGDYTIRSDSGTFANGFLYWITKKRGLWHEIILVLDLKTMVFSDITSESWLTCFILGTYNERLCKIYENSRVIELRFMNEHGFVESRSTACSMDSFSRMFNIRDDGKVLKLKSEQLVIYDMFKDSYNEVNTLGSFRNVRKLQYIDYVESSISISDICSHAERS